MSFFQYHRLGVNEKHSNSHLSLSSSSSSSLASSHLNSTASSSSMSSTNKTTSTILQSPSSSSNNSSTADVKSLNQLPINEAQKSSSFRIDDILLNNSINVTQNNSNSETSSNSVANTEKHEIKKLDSLTQNSKPLSSSLENFATPTTKFTTALNSFYDLSCYFPSMALPTSNQTHVLHPHLATQIPQLPPHSVSLKPEILPLFYHG